MFLIFILFETCLEELLQGDKVVLQTHSCATLLRPDILVYTRTSEREDQWWFPAQATKAGESFTVRFLDTNMLGGDRDWRHDLHSRMDRGFPTHYQE